MPLENPQLIAFANENLRPLANALVDLNQRLIPTMEEYEAKNLGTIISDGGAGELIVDGSAQDGRTPVTGGDVFNLITLVTDLQAFLTAGRIDVIYKWQTRE